MRPVFNFDEGTRAKRTCAMRQTPHCGSSLRAISSEVEFAADVPQGLPQSDRQRGAMVGRASVRLGHGGFHDTTSARGRNTATDGPLSKIKQSLLASRVTGGDGIQMA